MAEGAHAFGIGLRNVTGAFGQQLDGARVLPHVRVGERQRRSPGAAEHQPFVDAQMQAQPLQIRDQELRRVVLGIRVRGRTAAAALVEKLRLDAPPDLFGALGDPRLATAEERLAKAGLPFRCDIAVSHGQWTG